MRLKGKVAIVTGSARGIGRAIALEFAKEGASVIVNYSKSKTAAEELAKSIGSKAIAVKADVSKKEDAERLLASAKKFGRLDILVNNAGHSSDKVWFAKLDDIDDVLWYSALDIDLKGTFLCSRAASKIMLKQGSGKIVNVSSIPALVGDERGLVYTVAKAGVLGLTKALARMLAPKIQVNAMVLGSIKTGWIDWLDNKELDEIMLGIPLKRLGKPEDVAKLAVFLASSDSDFITGQSVVIDGGETMS
ncbi:MAG: 3-oxoacyl-ACP reductase FabG [Thaumarchaeota archaeon]|nr:3-oxoacyl-ACP reductase FabG [Nitrososphaerota archaeon]